MTVATERNDAGTGTTGREDLFVAVEDGPDTLAVPVFILAAVLVFGGFYLMASAFGGSDFAYWIFLAGLLADALGFWIAFGWWPNRRR